MRPDRPSARLATRLAFLIAGFGIACWAPLIPFAKQRLMVNDGILGLLLLCLGVGSIVAMMLAGVVNVRYGSRPTVLAGCLGMTIILPLLPLAHTALELGSLLFVFGAALGSLDVAMNIHAVEVERASGRSLMSGFHALYSIGGFVGSGFMTFLLSVHFGAFASTLTGAILMLTATAILRPRLLRGGQAEAGHVSVIPRGIVWLLAILAGITFLAEGAVLDWSALLMTSRGLVTDARGGLGYMLFSVTMTAGRMCGDAIVGRIGDRNALFWGSILATAGFAFVASASTASVAIAGFILIGAGASNIVPVLFRRAGAQTVMPAGLAVSAISTCGYAGILVGPAAVGYLAKLAGLPAAFWMLAGLLALVTITARSVTAEQKTSLCAP
jgi:predicted MFS family arabinose efflux permease